MLQICMHFHFKRRTELSLLLKLVSQLLSTKASESSKVSVGTLRNIREKEREKAERKLQKALVMEFPAWKCSILWESKALKHSRG